MLRSDIINSLIKKISAKKYLEIGVSNGINFSEIACDYKVGVDPDPNSPSTIHLTSDDFFRENKERFDVIFIDGLHHSDQVYRDIINSLNCLNDDGYIVCHDMNPWEEHVQTIPLNPETHTFWTGNCWKAFVQLRRERSDLEMYVVDTDCGCGIIRKGRQDPLKGTEELTWENLKKNRKEWLNLVSIENFLQKVNNNVQTFDLNNLLYVYIFDPENSENNFLLGKYYESIGQTASAISYYIRSAERSNDDLLKYECLIRASICFNKQGTRNHTVKGLLLHALSVCPKRPEAYYLMSRFYENEDRDGKWNECYMISSVGLKVSDEDLLPLRTDVTYPGKYGLLFQKAKSGWWCGLCQEAKDLYLDLLDNYDMLEEFRQFAITDLKKMNVNVKAFSTYSQSKFEKLGIKFKGSENIKENYSEAYQDMFVLTMLNGKKKGTYLEIGAGNSFYGNNTALLERDFDWEGVALDIDEGFVNAHTNERKNPCLLKDATKINYESFLSGLGFSNEIDYLQLDCDPPEVTYKILLTIPFETYKFAVITYEHDYYCDETKSFQDKSKKYLESYGYVRVVNNISPDSNRSYEDWWVHPDLVDSQIINKMMNISDETKKAEDYILSTKLFHKETYAEKENKEFDWGLIEKNGWFRETVEKEIFIDDIYQKFFRVEEGDIVFDIGASVGPFTYHIKKQNPKKVYCFEPHKELYKTLSKNVSSDNVVCINKSVGSSDDEYTTKGLFNEDITECFSDQNIRTVPSTKFSTFIKENNIEKIDFLKSDCEGGEYEIFNEENFDWIVKNVRKISGEWHLVTKEQKDLFKNFRDTYLKELSNHQIFSIDNVNIKWGLWDDWFIDHYGLITLYIDNTTLNTKEDKSFDWGLFEKNEWLSVPIKEEFKNGSNYEKFFEVEEDDLVLDVGASVGPFTNSILSKNPRRVLCLEPHPQLFETLKNNFSQVENVICINKGISSIDGEVTFNGLFDDTKDANYSGNDLWKKEEKGLGITFKTLIKENNIEKVNFLKIDCEGGEYDVFTSDNFYWIKSNIEKIAGEWHLHNDDLKLKFLNFRDFYLRKFDNFKIFFVDYHSNFFDITNEVWNDDFISKYGWVNIYIDNR